MWSFILYILIGACAGYFAGQLTRGQGYGIWVNIVIGVLGGILGGVIIGLLGFKTSNIIGSLITSVLGAVVLLWILSLFRKS